MELAVVTCWPPSVATGSGTAVAQHGLTDALARADARLTVLATSSFASSWRGIARRYLRNAARMPKLDRYDAVFGVDGEGWLWARRHARPPYVALAKAVLTDVIPFEGRYWQGLLRVQAGWEAAGARQARAVITASGYAADRLARGYGVQRDTIQVVPEPFDFGLWRARLPSVPPSEREPLVLAVGHAYPRKNYAALLRAWPLVARQRPDARLVLAGHGPEQEALNQLALGQPTVSIIGHVPFDELLDLYARARVFCHPSLQENFGIAVVEGLAAGLGVVVHQQPAVVETVTGVPGTWVTDTRSPERLSAALLEALDGPPVWPDARLDGLRARLDPATVGRQVQAIVESVR
ncbi:MAG: glycosyltransferase family 4 protein [Chloroflexota bacterium]